MYMADRFSVLLPHIFQNQDTFSKFKCTKSTQFPSKTRSQYFIRENAKPLATSVITGGLLKKGTLYGKGA